MPPPVVSATKQNLLMAVVITVHIAKLNSVLVAEEECLYAQIRKLTTENKQPKGSLSKERWNNRERLKQAWN
uniref:Uncharacterized protein n=1 Tax=Chelonoidis abingdonii TaxID=106734 RepID=A0A8C0GF98_CHEAB